jgi:hypothetical protein
VSISAWTPVVLIVALLALGVPCPAAYAQGADTAAASVLRERLHLRAVDWRAQAKASSGIQVDTTVRLHMDATTGHITSAPLQLPFPVNGVGLHWDATRPRDAALAVSVRVRSAGAGWSAWVSPGHRTQVAASREGVSVPTAYAGDTSAGLLLTPPDARFVQVRLTLRAAAEASPVLRRLSLYAVNATDGPAPPSRLPPAEQTDSTSPPSKPPLSTREDWNARPPRAHYRHSLASHLALHHTATAGPGAADTWQDCAAAVRAIQDYHMNTRGWIDIGYNYLVCQTGDIFQGREDEDDGRDVVGAHDGYNDGSVGTAALGYFHPPENQQPSSVLIDSYVRLFGWIAERRGIAPDGTSIYPSYGPLHTVYGHRDVKATACPGDRFYPERTAIVERLKAVVSDTSEASDLPAETVLSPSYPNPAQSRARFDLQLSTGGRVTATVYDLLGRRVVRRRYGYHTPGRHTVSLRTSGWAAGTYLYELEVDETLRTGTLRVVQ